jgi:hypothetical protein
MENKIIFLFQTALSAPVPPPTRALAVDISNNLAVYMGLQKTYGTTYLFIYIVYQPISAPKSDTNSTRNLENPGFLTE